MLALPFHRLIATPPIISRRHSGHSTRGEVEWQRIIGLLGFDPSPSGWMGFSGRREYVPGDS